MIGSGILALFAALALQAADVSPSIPLIEPELNAAPTVRAAESADAVTDSAANAKSNRVACREEIKPNSRFTKRVCRKAKDWEHTAQTSQSNLVSIQLRGNSQQGEGPNAGP
jgi:hypothetical protein